MTFFDSIYDKLFNRNHNKNKVLSHEPLIRSDMEKKNFRSWLLSDQSADLVSKLYRSYHLKKTDIDGDIPFLMFNSVYANGFAIKNNAIMDSQDFSLLLDYFRHKLIELGYRQAGSDKKHTAKEGYVLSVDKFYMKPPLQTEPPINQLYGNVSIELHSFNDQPNYLKVMASIYSDRLYQKHYDYDELVEGLLSPDGV